MKKSKILIGIIIICLISFSFTSLNNNNNDPYVIVRVIECQGGDTANKSMILIDRGDNSIEKIELEKFHKNNFESNFKIISKKLNDIKAEGYKIISTSGGGGNDNAMILQNYIFEKE
jgi:hypothetical protein